MYTIDTDKVIHLVCMYAHLPMERRGIATELAESACAYLSSVLLRDPENTQEETACIHAAACVALCDLARMNSSAFEPVITETGSFSSHGKSVVNAQSAEKLMRDAFERMGDMLEADKFFFKGVDG